MFSNLQLTLLYTIHISVDVNTIPIANILTPQHPPPPKQNQLGLIRIELNQINVTLFQHQMTFFKYRINVCSYTLN